MKEKNNIGKKYFTFETRLSLEDKEFINYIKELMSLVSKIRRKVYRYIVINKGKIDKNKLKKDLAKKYNLQTRTIDNIIRECLAIYISQNELIELEIKSIQTKILLKENKINILKNKINKTKIKAYKLTGNKLNKYRLNKKTLYQLQGKVNCLKQYLDNLNIKLKNKSYYVCFGTKSIWNKQFNLKENNLSFNKWKKEFINKRDFNIYFEGESSKKAFNSFIKLNYNENLDNFNLQLTVDKLFIDKYGKYFNKTIDFKYKYLKNRLIELLNKKENLPIHYRLIFKDNKLYLKCSVAFIKEKEKFETNSFYGTIGIDFNKKHIALSQTNKDGNLIDIKNLKINSFKNKNKNKNINQMYQVANEIVNYAKTTGKDIIIEDLNFKIKRNYAIKNVSNTYLKRYNNMLHSLAYKRYTDIIISVAFKHNVFVKKINPMNTSKIGFEKYSKIRKLNIHTSASFVIARKGQGFIDKLAN